MDKRKRYVRYGRMSVILLASGSFFLLSLYLKTWTEHNIFPILYPAVVVSAWVGGRLGGVIATLVLSLGTAYFHLPPDGLAVEDPADLIRLGTFTITGTFVAWLCGALKDSQGIMMATLRSIGDGVIATDRRGRVRFLNPVAERLTGWSQKDAKGRLLKDVFCGFHAETGEEVRVPLPMALHGAVNIENTCLISKAGSQVAVDDSLAPVEMETGRTFGSILVFRDATKRRQSEAAGLESQRQRLQAQRMEAVGRLAGGVAHDFNNLLTIITGYAELSLREMAAGSSGQKSVEEIRKAGQRASSLTRQLLVFSRGQPAKLEIVDLNRLVANFEPMLRRLIGEDIKITTHLLSSPVSVKADAGQIEQVIMNLAVNARDAMPRGGNLTITTELKAGVGHDIGRPESLYAVLAVTDTGVGIDENDQSRLFEPFFTTKEIGKGTGLGLSVIYGIVTSLKGHVRVQSQPGKGSVFEVYLPLAEGLPDAPAVAAPEPVKPGIATILLVEDNPEVRQLMQKLLLDLGYKVLEAGDGNDALLLAERHPGQIDLLVTDLVMPGISGLELANQLTRTHPDLKVLYVSGYADHETAARALRDPIVEYLQKPFVLSDLARKIETIVARSKKDPDS